MMISTSDSIIRLVVAIILGGLIGYENDKEYYRQQMDNAST